MERGLTTFTVDNNFYTVVSQPVGCTVPSVCRETFSWINLFADTTLVVYQKQHCKYNRVNCGSVGLIIMVEQMAQSTEWLPELPSSQRRITGSSQQNYRFSSKLSYSLQNFLILRNTSQNTKKIQSYKIMKTISRYKNNKRSRSSKLKRMQKYAYAYVFIFIALNRWNGVFIMRINGFLLHSCCHVWLLGSPDTALGIMWVAAQKGWQSAMLLAWLLLQALTVIVTFSDRSDSGNCI